ncbi:MAG: DUF3775 domain-containing protein [Oricola sp.]|jgi:hypothetical protein|nr:DUF3775 domain-containing protein [Oricola sp.]
MILDPDTACALIFKIRRLHGKEIAGPDVIASNDVDEGQPAGASMDDALVEGQDRGNLAEIQGLLEGLESEQLEELAGLFLMGRDSAGFETLNEAKAASREWSVSLLDYMADEPASAEYLASGLERCGIRCDDRSGAR